MLRRKCVSRIDGGVAVGTLVSCVEAVASVYFFLVTYGDAIAFNQAGFSCMSATFLFACAQVTQYVHVFASTLSVVSQRVFFCLLAQIRAILPSFVAALCSSIHVISLFSRIPEPKLKRIGKKTLNTLCSHTGLQCSLMIVWQSAQFLC